MPKWRLAVLSPEHDAYDQCLECEGALEARQILLASRSSLTSREVSAPGVSLKQPPQPPVCAASAA